VDYFSPGLREISRKLGRQRDRLRLAAERRKLAHAETELGLLGWQQADYDQETQREVEKIQNYEREQARLTNESAELSRSIRDWQMQRGAIRKEFDEKRRQLEAERRDAVEPMERIEKQLVMLRKQEPAYGRRMPELDRELREVNRLYIQLLTSDAVTPQLREELMKIRERTVAIPNEKADLRSQHLRVVSEMKRLETTLAQANVSIAGLDKQLHALQTEFAASERDIAAEIRKRDRENTRLEKEINALETAKVNPYQQIGRVLADSNLAPMNQPQTLEEVRRRRFIMQELEYKIAFSLQMSHQVDQTLVRTSYLIWAAMSAAILLTSALLLTD
jgi:chromosome segregation ATPase